MRRGFKGAILMDVLVAAFILSVGLVAVAGLFIQTSRAGHVMNHEEAAVFLAQDAMERLRNRGSAGWTVAALSGAAVTDAVEHGGMHFDRTTLLQIRPDLDSSAHLVEAVVTVDWQEKNQPRRTVLMTYFAVNTELENLR
jgi:Tfp pilus assembly protein PilV